jgi:hypothetical protein
MFIECLENIVDTFKIPKTEKIPYCLLTIIYIDCPKCTTTKHKIPQKIKYLNIASYYITNYFKGIVVKLTIPKKNEKPCCLVVIVFINYLESITNKLKVPKK